MTPGHGRPRATLGPVRSVRPFAVALAALLAISTGCGGDDDRQSDAGEFCRRGRRSHDARSSPHHSTTRPGVEATLDFYRVMGELAPLSIAEEWNQLVLAVETAASLEPGNPDSEQLVAATAYATEPAAYAVKVVAEPQLRARHPDHDDRPARPRPGDHHDHAPGVTPRVPDG